MSLRDALSWKWTSRSTNSILVISMCLSKLYKV